MPISTVLVNKDEKFPSKYVSTKSIEETLSELCSSVTGADISWLQPELVDLNHEELGTVEAIYTCTVERGIISPKNEYQIISLDEFNIEDKYAKSIISAPRSVGNRY